VWYREYRVRECWLVDPFNREVEVLDLTATRLASRMCPPEQLVRSAVLPRLRLRPASLFTGG